MLCSECNKNPAILFYKKIENGKESLEGYCYNCAKSKGIDPNEVLYKQNEILAKDNINLNDMSKQFETIFKDLAENINLEDIENIDGAITFDNSNNPDGESKISGAAIPLGSLFSNMFNNPNNNNAQETNNNSKKKIKVEKKKNTKQNKKKKFLDTYGTNLTFKAKNNQLDLIVGRDNEIKRIICQFIEGAVRVKKAGCDGVELHAAHGYLIQQFLSPNTNKRTDQYGGSLENRMRFLLEIIDGIRSNCGKDFPIVVRLTVDEMYSEIGQNGKGYNLEEGIKMAKILSDKGIDAIDVSSAAYDTFNYWLEPTTFTPGWRKYLASEVKKVVDIPVIAANLIRSPKQAEMQLEEGTQDFISLGRPLIADPHWPNKVKSGNENLIKRCVCCLYCFESMMKGAYKYTHGNCSVNPFVGRENVSLKQNGNGRKVLIIGAGCAGLTAAELLSKRGFDVTVLEKESKQGGQLNLASKPPHKEKINWVCEDLLSNAINSGAKVLFDIKADKDIIASYSPEIVITATGGNAIHPKSFNGDNVVTVTQILNGDIDISNKKVAVIGSGMTGLETSELLVSKGNKVTVVEMADKIAPGAWFQQLDDALPVLEKAGTEFLTSHKLLSVSSSGIELENLKENKAVAIKVDLVVLSLGVRSDNSLYNDIKSSDSYKVYNIGDSNKIGRIANATESAYQLVMNIE